LRLRALLTGGLVVGCFDIVYAMTFWYLYRDVPPTRVLQSVASGVLGRDAFTGGNAAAALGLALHFFIAVNVVAAYYLVSGRLAILLRRPVVFGALYGVAVYFVMQHVVVPLSASPPPKNAWLPIWVVCSLLVHAFLIGVPAALFARRARRGAR
jgi:hypothetical protein